MCEIIESMFKKNLSIAASVATLTLGLQPVTRATPNPNATGSLYWAFNFSINSVLSTGAGSQLLTQTDNLSGSFKTPNAPDLDNPYFRTNGYSITDNDTSSNNPTVVGHLNSSQPLYLVAKGQDIGGQNDNVIYPTSTDPFGSMDTNLDAGGFTLSTSPNGKGTQFNIYNTGNYAGGDPNNWNPNKPVIPGCATMQCYIASDSNGNEYLLNWTAFQTVGVPEPLNLLGSITLLGMGFALKRQIHKSKK